MTDHVDATGYSIAISLIDDGYDADWVLMVMEAKGHGRIDLAAARQWLTDNPKAMCRCFRCAPIVAKPKPTIAQPAQMSLF